MSVEAPPEASEVDSGEEYGFAWGMSLPFPVRWEGRDLTLEELDACRRAVQERIMELFYASVLDREAFDQMAIRLARLGTEPEERALLERDIQLLLLTPEGVMVGEAGAFREIGKFWKKHKKAIIIGAIVVGVVVTAVVLTACTAGTAASGVAATGCSIVNSLINEEDEKKKKDPHKEHSQTAPVIENSPISAEGITNPSFLGIPGSESVNLSVPSESFSEALAQEVSNASKVPLPINSEWDSSLASDLIDSLNLSDLEKYLAKDALNNSYPPLNFTPEFKPTVNPGAFLYTGNAPAASNKPKESPRVPNETPLSVPKEPDFCIIGQNGIATTLAGAQSHQQYLQNLVPGSHTVDWVYNKTNTAVVDVAEALICSYNGISKTAGTQQAKWEEFHQANIDNPSAKILQICHSKGSIDTYNALGKARKEIRDRVIIINIAPGKIIPREMCYEAHNYASELDIVHLGELFHAGFFDSNECGTSRLMEQILENRKQLILLKPHPDATGIDHGLQSPTFRDPIRGHIQDYIDHKGEYN